MKNTLLDSIKIFFIEKIWLYILAWILFIYAFCSIWEFTLTNTYNHLYKDSILTRMVEYFL